MERRIQTFKAREENGTEHTISVFLGCHEITGEAGHMKMSEDSLREMRTEDGRFVQLSDGGFEIIDGTRRIRLTSNDPNAPKA
jgi:hypothetical protein